MDWILGYLIGIVTCVIILALTGFICDDDETVWLIPVIWPLILIGYLVLLVYAIVVYFIDKCYFIINRTKEVKKPTK